MEAKSFVAFKDNVVIFCLLPTLCSFVLYCNVNFLDGYASLVLYCTFFLDILY